MKGDNLAVCSSENAGVGNDVGASDGSKIRQTSEDLEEARRNKRYLYYCFAVCLSALFARTLIAFNLSASGMFSDDYGYLKKSIYYLRGDFAMGGTYVDPQHQWGGFGYSVVVSLWKLFKDPYLRHQTVFFINSLLAVITSLVCCLIFVRLTTVRSWLAPLCLATIPVVFLFPFYALTENVFFSLVVLSVFLLLKHVDKPEKWTFLAGISLCVTFASLTRSPGLVIALSLALVVGLLAIQEQTATLWQRVRSAIVRGGIIFLPCLSVYALFSWHTARMLAVSREGKYLQRTSKVFESSEHLYTVLSLAGNQLYYVILSSGVFLFVGLCLWFARERFPRLSGQTAAEAAFFLAVVLCGTGMLATCTFHLIVKTGLKPEQDSFIYGRYDDPGLILFVLAGVLVVANPSVLNQTRKWLLLGLASCLVFLAMARVEVWQGLTINQAGLYVYNYPHSRWLTWIVPIFTLAAFAYWPRKFSREVIFFSTLCFNLLTINRGVIDSSWRSAKNASSFGAGLWISEHVAEDECVFIDNSLRATKLENSTYRFENVMRAMYFLIYPRELVDITQKSARSCQLFFLPQSVPSPEGYEAVWQDTRLVVYKKAESQLLAR